GTEERADLGRDQDEHAEPVDREAANQNRRRERMPLGDDEPDAERGDAEAEQHLDDLGLARRCVRRGHPSVPSKRRSRPSWSSIRSSCFPSTCAQWSSADWNNSLIESKRSISRPAMMAAPSMGMPTPITTATTMYVVFISGSIR